MVLLEGKTALIFGVANDHSIAWGIAKAMHEHGARLAFSYAGEAFERRVRPLAQSVGSSFVEACDVARRRRRSRRVFERGRAGAGQARHPGARGGLRRRETNSDGPSLDTRATGFHTALDVSAYSLTALARAAAAADARRRQRSSR